MDPDVLRVLERFTTFSDDGGYESIQIVMGCGFHQEIFIDFGNNHLKGKPDLIAGVLDLGRREYSFLKQLRGAGQDKFSYCLEIYSENIYASSTYLTFGEDAIIGGQVRKTPIVVNPFQPSGYYINLEDISVADESAGFVSADFKIKDDGSGGCLVDSGAPYTVMYRDHFNRVATRDGHGAGADYVVSERASLFVELRGNICLLIGALEVTTNMQAVVLGALQQTNKRLLYNNMIRELSFADEICRLQK
ncbi:aspartic proteinase nepenthesin-2-like [Papaver somniferum]|uniref:aspartic proteinase nepenthesin-2-like n=1 Tax=Papaver somniferum TaxID=3469 RepID=UPI000E701F24|nr:aspartic proteinase nepenthesin-2-like [Papaver somniferum]